MNQKRTFMNNNINYEKLRAEFKKKAEEMVANITDTEELRSKRDEYNERTKNIIIEANRLEEEIKAGRERAIEFRDKRNEYNKQLQEIKEKRRKIFEEMREIKKKIEEERKKEQELQAKERNKNHKRRDDPKRIRRQINALEQKIITENIDMKEETELINEIEKLELKLAELENKGGSRAELNSLYQKKKELEQELKELGNELEKIREESQNYHLLMNEEFREIDGKKEELDKLRIDKLESKLIADEFHNKYIEYVKKQWAVKRLKGRNLDNKVKYKIRKEIQEATLMEAMDKKKKGKKLNIFEARALFENASHSEEKK
ncbi:MAG: hypothetical protein ACTSU2_06370 [Promethearchaeota archaeon]